MDIGKKIRELRLQNDLTLEDLASRSELTKGFLSQLERNLTSPSISTLEDILEAIATIHLLTPEIHNISTSKIPSSLPQVPEILISLN